MTDLEDQQNDKPARNAPEAPDRRPGDATAPTLAFPDHAIPEAAPQRNRPAVDPSGLEEQIRRVATTITDASLRFTDLWTDSVHHALQEAFSNAESDVVRLVGESGLAEASAGSDDIDAREAWTRIRTFRRGIQTQILEPLSRRLAEIDTGERTATLFARLLRDITSLPDTVPEQVQRPEPPTLYAAAESDNPVVGLRKLALRLSRRTADIVRPTEHVQNVNLQAIVRAHVQDTIPALLLTRLDKALYAVALAVAGVERELARLMHELLQAEARLDEPANHLPAETVRSLSFGEEEPADEPRGGDTVALEASAEEETPAAALAESLEKIRLANARLRQALQDACNLTLKNWRSGFTGAMILAVDALKNDIERSDTFMTRKVIQRGMRTGDAGEGMPSHAVSRRWIDWHRETVDRFRFLQSLASLRDALTELQASAIDGALGIGLVPAAEAHRQTAAELRNLHAQAERFFAGGLHQDGLAVMVRQLETLQTRCADRVQEGVIHPAQRQSLEASLARSNDGILDRLQSLRNAAAEEVRVHPLPDAGEERLQLDDELRTISLRTIVGHSVDDPFPIDLRAASSDLVAHVDELLKADEEVVAVIRFNLGAAREEIEEGQSPEGKGRSAEEVVEAARELTLNGLARSADALMEARTTLGPVAVSVTVAYFEVFQQAWTYLHEHARAESQVQKAIAAARSAVSEQSRSLAERARERIAAARRWVRKSLRFGRRKAGQLVRLGQEAVGVQAEQEAAFEETMEALTNLEQTIEKAPLIYRRLFSFHPLSDPDLMEGRVDDKRRLIKHIQAWRKGIPQAFLLTGSPSAGITSFLNVMEETAFKQFEVRRLELSTRVLDGATLARLVGETIGAVVSEGPNTLERLAAEVLKRSVPEQPIICIVEHLELLFLRTIRGTKLIREFLTFTSRTDSRILWILTTGVFGWQLVEKTEPAASRLVIRHELTATDRQVLESLILKRHSRSGLNLQFLSPSDSNPLLSRRLSRTTGDDEGQAVLREHYFDRLHAQCGPNILLALFYWLSSVSLNDEETGMTVRQINPLKFSFLSSFSLEHSLALKALLEHESLTVEEFARVDGCSTDSSMEIFESLGNSLLIEAATEDAATSRFEFITIRPGIAYRVRPLIVYPLIQYLRGKNIVH